MAKIEIDKNGQVDGFCPDEIEKNDRLKEMSANKTLCLLSEKCDKGHVTRIMTMDGDCSLVGKASRSLITEMTDRNFWPSRWEVEAYYSLYGDSKRRLNKAEIGPGVAFYPVTDSQRNTSWNNVAVITGVTGTARGTVIETKQSILLAKISDYLQKQKFGKCRHVKVNWIDKVLNDDYK